MGDIKRRLIACQHCGQIYLTQNEVTGKWGVACDCGFAKRKIGWYDTEREAIKRWNYVAMDWEA